MLNIRTGNNTDFIIYNDIKLVNINLAVLIGISVGSSRKCDFTVNISLAFFDEICVTKGNNRYISLSIAMVAGRSMGGIASAVFYTVTTGVYSVALWFTSYFAEAVPGIVTHLVLVPVLVFSLQKAHLIPKRYAAS